MIVVITGSNGFTAEHLAKYIKSLNTGIVICGTDLAAKSNNSFVDKYFSISELDLLTGFLNMSEDNIKVFHLAGLLRCDDLTKLFEANVLGTVKYLELFRNLKNRSVFVNIGSSAEYGNQKEKYLCESLTPKPVSPYGVSKYLQSELVLHTSGIFGFKAISLRTFNLIGPGLSKNFIAGKIISEFLKIKNHEKDICRIGRTDTVRNFIDVRDAVKIYWILSEHGINGEIYNAGHTESHSVAELINVLSEIIGIVPVISSDSGLVSQFDIDFQYNDPEKTNRILNNFKYLTLEESLRDIVSAV